MQKERNTRADFLSDGGELGALIRSFDWATSDIGAIDNWPQSLKPIFRLLLASKQPMLVWWGPSLIQFYNDAYLEILGHDGKQPLVLGQKAKDYWAERWLVIYPLIKEILSGASTWVEDELIPVFRNGKLDEVHWTFAYTPIHNDLGEIDGVLVTCNKAITKGINHQLFVHQANQLFMQAPVAFCTLHGKNFIIESVNNKMLELWGKVDKKEVLGIPIFDVFPETVNQGIKELLNHTFETGTPYVTMNGEIKILHNGKLKQLYLKVMCQPLLDESGNVVSIMGLADDITELVIKRKNAAENELKTKIAITSAALGTYQIDLLTNKVTGDKRFYELSDLEHSADKKDFTKLLYQNNAEAGKKLCSEALTSGKLFYEKKNILKDNSLYWLRIYGQVIFDNLKKPVKILGVVEDITQSKLLTEENNELLTRQIQESQRLQLFESVISHTKEGVLIIEILNTPFRSHKAIYCNDALIAISGYSKDQIIGKTVDWINKGKVNSTHWKKLKESIVNQKAYELEWGCYRNTEKLFWNNMCISPVIDEHGNYTHCIAIIKDITLRKQKDKEITLAILQAQEAERFQIGAELHDNVNQILAGTLISLGIAKDKMTKKENVHIEQSIEYLRMGIEEIRRISHWLAPVYHDEKALIASFQKLLRDINRNNLFVIHFKSENMTDSSISDNIQLNLYRILQEQMTNIIKYSEATVIEVTLKRMNNEVSLNIDDNGIGINTKKYQQGIGLNNIRKRVELLSGNYSLISSLGNGCKIRVRIPLNEEMSKSLN